MMNKRLKSVVVFILACFFLCGLVGCSGSTDSVASSSAADSSSETSIAPELSSESSETSSSEEAVPQETLYWFTTEQVQGDESYSYVQVFSNNEQVNAGLGKLNESWRSETESAYAHKFVEGGEIDPESNMSFAQSITYFDKGVAGVSTQSYIYSGGAHGYVLPSTAVYKLDTTELTTPYEYIGVSQDQIESWGREALDVFLQQNGGADSMLKSNSAEVFEYDSFWNMVENGSLTLNLTPDGIVLFCNNYVVGPYAAGVASFLLCDLEGNPAQFNGEMYEFKTIDSPLAPEGWEGSSQSAPTDADSDSSTKKTVEQEQQEVRDAAIAAGMQVFSGTVRSATSGELWKERAGENASVDFQPDNLEFIVLEFDAPCQISGTGAGYSDLRTKEGDSINISKELFSSYIGKHITVAAKGSNLAWPSDIGGVLYSVTGTVTMLYEDGQAPVVSADFFGGQSAGDYILPDSATRLYSRSELEAFESDDLSRAQNEIWARHGRMFKNQWLQDYFNAQSWYTGTISPDDFNTMYKSTEIEDENASLISEILTSRGWDVNKAHPN